MEKIRTDELELLKFSLKWLRFTMFGEGDIKVREGAKAKSGERRKLLSEARLKEHEEREKKAEEDLKRLRAMREKKD